MEKNPFSLFDFLGYFIPGSFALFLIYFLQNENGLEFYFKRTNVETLKTDMSILFLTFFIILAYTFGHILSFLSTLTIENFTIWMFGYPSKNLLNIPRSERYFEKKLKNSSNTINWPITLLSYTLRFLLAVFLTPITLFSITIGKLLDLNRSVYTKKIGDPYIDIIKSKIKKRFKMLNSNLNLDFTKHDYNKFLIHFSYNINLSHQPKLMNYVALYGFLRVISFIFNILSLYLLLDIIYLSEDKLIINFHYNFSTEFITLTICAFMTYVSYLGYLKFYRRYSQENLMILLL